MQALIDAGMKHPMVLLAMGILLVLLLMKSFNQLN